MSPLRSWYHAEHFLLAPEDISMVSLSPSAGLVALSRGSRVSLHPIPKSPATAQENLDPDVDEEVSPVYTQDGGSDVTALVWLTEDTFVAGYADGTVTLTNINTRVKATSVGVRASTERIVAFLSDPSGQILVVLTLSDLQLWEVSPTLIPTCKHQTSGFTDPQYLCWSSRAFKSIYVVGAYAMVTWNPQDPDFSDSKVIHLERDYKLKCVSWDGRYRLHGIQRSDHCHLTYTDQQTGKQTFFKFLTPHLEDRDFVASFVHGDTLLLLASSHGIVLWDPSQNQRTLQEFHYATAHNGQNPPKLKAISVASRLQPDGIVHTLIIVRGPEAIVWQAMSDYPSSIFSMATRLLTLVLALTALVLSMGIGLHLKSTNMF
ncbi:hypothetical protein C8F04DRAFT_1284542 [Mycena alexandri]|uniref:Uncharacterized protein n=1 Tax=Mycena alexandri TaxID=1745969 RepID=A0AAD6RW19_9AGAR|nr:hypothetical protein C8F04DRAFT_1284542 [Mycena alexandri]